MTTFTLYNADCLEKMKDISGGSIDLILCDLPYGCLSGRSIGKAAEDKKCYSGGEKGCAWDIPIDLEAFWKEVKRIRKSEHSPTIHFCTTKFGNELINSNPKEFRYDLVWTKTNAVGFLAANKMPMRAHEMMYVFSKAGAYYERIDIKEDFSAEQRCVKSYTEVANKKQKGGHPTAKPVELYKWLIERYCPPDGTVLDPTFGSCNSGKAAKELGRNYIGIEKDEGFFNKASPNIVNADTS